jgi:hypothetical protein
MSGSVSGSVSRSVSVSGSFSGSESGNGREEEDLFPDPGTFCRSNTGNFFWDHTLEISALKSTPVLIIKIYFSLQYDIGKLFVKYCKLYFKCFYKAKFAKFQRIFQINTYRGRVGFRFPILKLI